MTHKILYQVTVSLDPVWEKDWTTFLLTKHLDDVVNTGCFTEASLRKVIHDDAETVTYVSEYLCENMDQFRLYQNQYAATLRNETLEKFNGKISVSRMLLEVLR